MFALIAFFVGLIILFKGGFRLGTRTVSKPQARSISLYLMAPLFVLFCASTVIVMNTPNIIQWSADGSSFTVNQSPSVMDYISNTTGVVELVVVGIALLLVIYTIFYAKPKPTIPGTPASPQTAPVTAATRPPDIMTVAEAAAYMRVTEKDVLGLIDQGKLGAARIGDTYRIARIAIEDFMSGAS